MFDILFVFVFIFIAAVVLNNSSCVLRVVWFAKTLISEYVSLILPIANEASCAAWESCIVTATNQKIVANTLCENFIVDVHNTELIVDIYECSFGGITRLNMRPVLAIALGICTKENFPSKSFSQSVNVGSAGSGDEYSLIVAFRSGGALLEIWTRMPVHPLLRRLDLRGGSCMVGSSQIDCTW